MTAAFSQRRFSFLVAAALLILLGAAITQAVFNERALKAQLAREAGAQADLLASAVTASLAFDDAAGAQDYVDAVQVNPNVLAAAVYDDGGRLVAGFARDGQRIPPVAVARPRTTTFQDGNLYVVRPVVQGGQVLGTARLRLRDTAPAQRLARFAGIALFAGLAALAVLILSVAQVALRRANRELSDRAGALAMANARLTQEMAERERAEEALRQSQKMEAIGQLTGGIAHDFNNLLMAASSGVELLERTEDPKRRKMLSESVRHAVERGAALTRQLLAFSRRSPLRAEVVDLPTHLEGMRVLLERSLREDIDVVLDAPSDLWPVEVDRGELELALINLAVNARDAMPTGGHLTISAHNVDASDAAADHVCLRVRDTGVGMAEAVAARVFEPFFTTKEVGKGTGLGLSQVYGFVRSSGGEVSVEGGEGSGATFVICLPRSLKAVTPVTASQRPAPEPATPTRALRILLVEDDDNVASGVGHMLRDLGHAYVRAPSASAALEMLERDPAFDLVFSDLVMPGEMDGLDLVKVVRRRWSSAPVLLTTGYSGSLAAVHQAQVPILHKPYGLTALSEAIARAAGLGDAGRAA